MKLMPMFANLLQLRFCVYKLIGQSKLRLKAKITNRVFACKALQGESGYNICINSDMTVSCNCQDYDGSGQIGDLKTQTLPEIFSGKKAQAFREKLASCHFPTSTCWVCSDFCLINKSEKIKYLTKYKIPQKGIMVENTVLCNLSCLGCDREKLLSIRSINCLPDGAIEKISDMLSKHSIKNVSFFNLGEPFLSEKFAHEIKTLRMMNNDVRIITSTNGVFVDTTEKMEAAGKFPQ